MSVYKDPVTGKWYYTVRLYDDYGNFVKQARKRGFTTKKEAKEAEALAGASVTNSGITFQEVRDAFMSHYKSQNKPVSTYTVERRLQGHIDPFFCNRKMENISAKDILQWQNKLVKEGMSPTYIKLIKSNLSGIFLFGIRYYGIKSNPCTIVENVKSRHKEEMQFWTMTEFRQFLKVVDDPVHYALFSTLFWTGMRKGELLALRWMDIESDRIHVRHSIAAKEGTGTWRLSTPKTQGSRRDIPMTGELQAVMADLFKQRRHLVEFNKDYFVFGDYKPLGATSLQRIFDKYMAISTVKRIRIHDFRHSFASAMIEAGVDVMVLAKMMGHTSREQVYKTYGHLYPDKTAEAIKKLESVAKMLPMKTKTP